MKNESKKIIFILDRSQAMGKIESETIRIFNTMIEEQKRQSENVTVTTLLCNHKCELLHNKMAIDEINPISDCEYWTGGKSALLDSIGNIILKTKEEQSTQNNPDEKVLFVILTGGIDNASTEFDLSQIQNMIKAQQECGWEFQFPLSEPDTIFSGQVAKAYTIFVNHTDDSEKTKIIREESDESFHLSGEQDDCIGRYHLKDEPDYTLLVGEYPNKETCWNAILDILGPEIAEKMKKQRQDSQAEK